MGKKWIKGLIETQYDVLNAPDSKSRLKYIVAGIKDGRFYNHAGTDFGEYDVDSPNTEFIRKDELDLSRLTASRLSQITARMRAFFSEEDTVADPLDMNEPADTCVDGDEDEKPKKSKKDEEAVSLEVDIDEVVAELKKAIKKGKSKKAKKLLALLPTSLKSYNKLAKKVDGI